MLKYQAKLFHRLTLTLDVGTWVAALAIVYHQRKMATGRILGGHELLHILPFSSYGYFILLMAFSWWVGSRMFRLYRPYRTAHFMSELGAIAANVLFVAGMLLTTAFLLRQFYLSRFILLATPAAAGLGIVANRIVIRAILWQVRRGGKNYRSVLVVGTGPQAREFIKTLEQNRRWGLHFAGSISVPSVDHGGAGEKVDPSLPPIPVLGTLSELPRILDQHVIDQVVFAVPMARMEDIALGFQTCQEVGVVARLIIDFTPMGAQSVELENMGGFPLLSFYSGPVENLSIYVKHGMDYVGALFLSILFGPIMILAAVAIRLESRGPIFFLQERIGKFGRPFVLIKFRTMVKDAEARRAELEAYNEADGPVFKMKDDPRITRIGRILRRYSIDELPQLFNILMGHMSVVGPRPPIPSEVDHYQRWQRRRLSMKPGLTCLWQISGRSNVDFEQWMKLDMDYIDAWSLWLDFKILLRTIPVVLGRKGAY